MKSNSEPIQYISLVGHKIQIFQHRVDILKRRSFPSPGPIALAEVTTRILSRSFNELMRLSDQIGHRQSVDIIDKAHVIHQSIITLVPPLLEAISQAEVESPVGGIIDAYAAICSKAQFGTRLIMYPKWEYNASYTEIISVLKNLTRYIRPDERENIFEGIHPYHVIITYPSSEDTIVLRLAVLAHEVGHFIDNVRNWSSEVFETQLIAPESLQQINALGEDDRTRLLQLLGKFSKPWIKEIVSDTIATCIMGPAYVYALEEFAYITPNTQPVSELISISHPPKRLRLRLMADLCKRSLLDQAITLGEFEKLSERHKQVFELVRSTIEQKSQLDLASIRGIREIPDVPDRIVSLLGRVLTNMLGIVTERIETKTRQVLTENWTCRPVDILHALILQESLEHTLPPSRLSGESSRMTSFAAIMNSGWFFLISNPDIFVFHTNGTGVNRHPNEVHQKYINVQNLIAKAVEILNFQTEFQRRRGRTS